MSSSPSVIVGLSGGVDSAVTALLLKQQGYRVSGLFMKNWDEDDDTEYCTARADLADAQQVADRLGIELLTANFAAEYWDQVFSDFLAEYQAGGTPNPDVLCNREIKFRYFADYARQLGADHIATGHYATLRSGRDGVELHRAADANKDQTYFLQAVTRPQLEKVLFPLGGWLKSEVRERAADAGFENHCKRDSTGICFIGERRFRDFLATYLPPSEGDIVDSTGRMLGRHPGVQFFTIGQRQGLGIGGVTGAVEAPWLVAAKDREHNRLVVTQNPADLEAPALEATQLNWIGTAPVVGNPLTARIRHRQPLQACTVTTLSPQHMQVRFEAPQRAINPGQYVCLYDGTRCLGGGKITRAMD
ncbi:MAG: tRNA 2-thiouridine(34) synthase MnmA [Pseudomonadota bacterium]